MATQTTVTIPSTKTLADAFDRGEIRDITRQAIAEYLDCAYYEVPLSVTDELWAEICRREGDAA